jgi:hypothetical protein
MLKLASTTSPNDGTDRDNTTVSRFLDFESFPLGYPFAPTENLHVNGFTRNDPVTQHDLTIQSPETKSASHQFFYLEEMGRSERQ